MARRTLHARLHSGKPCMGSSAPCYLQGAPVTIFLVTRAWLFGAMLLWILSRRILRRRLAPPFPSPLSPFPPGGCVSVMCCECHRRDLL